MCTPRTATTASSWRQRLFATVLRRLSGPHRSLLESRKRTLLSGLTGTVVEFGPGTGVNLPFLTRAATWVGVEPNPALHADIRRAGRAVGREVAVRGIRAERVDLPDACADAVVCTLVLCSVEDPPAVLAEARRLLRPGGRFVFIEHVGAPAGTELRARQEWWRPVFRWMGDGCRPDRDTAAAIRAAGFGRVELEEFRLPVPLVGPHIAGWAETTT